MEKAKISSLQLFLLIAGFLFGSTVILDPTSSAKNDAWISILLGGAGGILLMGIYVYISLLNPSKTLVEILRDKFGTLFGNIVAIMYIVYFIHIASLAMRDYGEFIVTATLLETPMIAVIIVFAVLLAYGINSGIEVIGRICELFVPIVPITVLVISLSLITTHDFTAFLPIMGDGIQPVLKPAFVFMSTPFGETVAFLMLFPHLNNKNSLKKATASALLFKLTLAIIIFFRDVSVLGGELLYEATFTPHLVSLLIPQVNLEPLIDINLLIVGWLKASVCIYAAVKALSQVFKIDDYRKLTIALTTFSVVLSIWIYNNIFEMFFWLEEIWPYYSLPFQVVFPLLLLILSFKKNGKSSNSNKVNSGESRV